MIELTPFERHGLERGARKIIRGVSFGRRPGTAQAMACEVRDRALARGVLRAAAVVAVTAARDLEDDEWLPPEVTPLEVAAAIRQTTRRTVARQPARKRLVTRHSQLVDELTAEGWCAREFRQTLIDLLCVVMQWDRAYTSGCIQNSIPDAWRIVPVMRDDGSPWFAIDIAEVNVTHWPDDDKWSELAWFCDYYVISLRILTVDRNGTRSMREVEL